MIACFKCYGNDLLFGVLIKMVKGGLLLLQLFVALDLHKSQILYLPVCRVNQNLGDFFNSLD